MNAPLFLERTDAYLNSQWLGPRTPSPAAKSAGPFVTLSREAGSGGSRLARMINTEAQTEGPWHVYEANLTAHMLQANHLPARLARYLPEDRIREPNASIGEWIRLHPNLIDLVHKTNDAMRELARAGRVVLVGRGANFATAGLGNGIHVRLVAPAAHRARYLAMRYGISEEEARRHNERCDAARRRYVRATFGADVSDPSAYDLTVNTERVSLEDAARLIWAHVQARLRRS